MVEPLITDEMRAQIGVESEPVPHEVTRQGIRMFARAVGHTDRIYYDVDAARAAGYRDIPCPPGYIGTPVFDPELTDTTTSRRKNGQTLRPSRPLTRRLAGGSTIEYHGDICAGDELLQRSAVASIEERNASLGQMLITTTKATFTNQNGEVVAVVLGTGLQY